MPLPAPAAALLGFLPQKGRSSLQKIPADAGEIKVEVVGVIVPAGEERKIPLGVEEVLPEGDPRLLNFYRANDLCGRDVRIIDR